MNSTENENGVVLSLVQATLGWISPEMRGISIAANQRPVQVNFAVSERNARVDDDIQEIMSEFDVAAEGRLEALANIYVGAPDDRWPGRAARLIFLEYYAEHELDN